MTCGISVIRGIPADKVDEVVANFELDSPPPAITKAQAADGTWTVTADYGPCADGSTPTTATSHSVGS